MRKLSVLLATTSFAVMGVLASVAAADTPLPECQFAPQTQHIKEPQLQGPQLQGPRFHEPRISGPRSSDVWNVALTPATAKVAAKVHANSVTCAIDEDDKKTWPDRSFVTAPASAYLAPTNDPVTGEPLIPQDAVVGWARAAVYIDWVLPGGGHIRVWPGFPGDPGGAPVPVTANPDQNKPGDLGAEYCDDPVTPIVEVCDALYRGELAMPGLYRVWTDISVNRNEAGEIVFTLNPVQTEVSEGEMDATLGGVVPMEICPYAPNDWDEDNPEATCESPQPGAFVNARNGDPGPYTFSVRIERRGTGAVDTATCRGRWLPQLTGPQPVRQSVSRCRRVR